MGREGKEPGNFKFWEGTVCDANHNSEGVHSFVRVTACLHLPHHDPERPNILNKTRNRFDKKKVSIISINK